MKHSVTITFLLVGMFLLAQFIGLSVIERYTSRNIVNGTVSYEKLPYGLEPPPINENYGFIFIIVGVLIGTGLVLILVKFRRINLWKFWFFLSASITMAVAFAAFVNQWAAIVFAAILAFLKVFRQNFLVHNITELFVYGGLAAIFVPILNVASVAILLILISVYDAYAVWKSKHMVTMAKFQAESKVFAGFLIPKGKEIPKKIKFSATRGKPSFALLGGGDVAFPLLFAGVVLKNSGFIPILFVIPLFSALSLLGLLWFSQKGKFYPAMPFLTAGTFLGYFVFLFLH